MWIATTKSERGLFSLLAHFYHIKERERTGIRAAERRFEFWISSFRMYGEAVILEPIFWTIARRRFLPLHRRGINAVLRKKIATTVTQVFVFAESPLRLLHYLSSILSPWWQNRFFHNILQSGGAIFTNGWSEVRFSRFIPSCDWTGNVKDWLSDGMLIPHAWIMAWFRKKEPRPYAPCVMDVCGVRNFHATVRWLLIYCLFQFFEEILKKKLFFVMIL